MNTYSVRIAAPQSSSLLRHLFPGDQDEHGAVLAVGEVRTERGVRLLVRDVFLARDGIDYVPGERGYRALTTDFIARVSEHCASEHLGYLAVHCHGGRDRVEFSETDLRSHERGYPALLDITNGGPVGALVFAENAVAGRVWTREGVHDLDNMVVVGSSQQILRPSIQSTPEGQLGLFHRQSLLFGARGQAMLSAAKVGIIGLGGAGSLLNEWLAHLGVGHIVGVDYDRMESTNRPRVVGATRWDSLDWLVGSRFGWARALGRRLAATKARVARRTARRANPLIRYDAIVGDVADSSVAHTLRDVDHLFLCADSAQSRLVFNTLVHQYLIPGVQVGAKVQVERATGRVLEVFTASRPVMPHGQGGCLQCNGLISARLLQEEALPPAERQRLKYVDDPAVHAPSVITLNAVAAAQAANEFLFGFLGLREPHHVDGYLMHFPRERQWRSVSTRSEDTCLQCGLSAKSSYGRGDRWALPCR
jgi:ThiF family